MISRLLSLFIYVQLSFSLRVLPTTSLLSSRLYSEASKKAFKASFDKQVTKSLSLEVPHVINEEALLDYQGPYSDFSLMEAGCVIEDLGLEILVGESTQPNGGRGLFIALQEGCSEVTLPRGTPICGYSRGTFTDQGQGDKTVAFAFYSTKTGVIYDKKLMSLLKVINYVTNSTDDLSRVIDGHQLYFDEEEADIGIMPLEEYPNRYFIPDETTDWNPSRYGMYANDLGYNEDINTAEAYIANSVKNNILQIVWRVHLEDGVFKPTWPVVILSQDVRFTNDLPMEVGIQYSWRYWLAAMQLAD